LTRCRLFGTFLIAMSARTRWSVAVVVTVCMTVGAGNLTAGTHWVPANAEIDEVVADTTITPPRHPAVLPLGTPIPFHIFRYPHVNDVEDVTFIADDLARKREQHGVYRSFAATHELKPLVVKGLPIEAHSTAKFNFVSGLQMDGDDYVFTGYLTEGGPGLFYWSNDKIITVARTGHTILPDQTAPLLEVGYGAPKNGRILYQAGDGAGTALVLFDVKSRAHRVLLRTGAPIPGRDGARFRYISPQNWMDETSIVFRAARVTNPHDAAGRKQWYWFEDYHAFLAKFESSTKISPNVGVYGWFGIDWNNPNAFDLTNLVTVADWTTPASSDGGTFTYFGSAPVDGGLVGFMGEVHRTSGSSMGIYCTYVRPNSTPVFRNIVDTDTEVESLFKGPFTGFNKWVAVQDGSVVFIGYAEGGKKYAGVFLYKPELDELFLLCDNRDPIDGKAVKGFEIGTNLLVRNRFAITIHFQDGSSGVYLATIPPNSFKRMTTGE
jgi:hypothetical protein